MKNSFEHDIAAPPERVFALVNDASRLPDWVPNIVENEELEYQEGKVGSTFRQVYDERGHRMEFDGVTTAWEANRRLGVHLTGKSFDMDVDYHLEPIDTGTRLRQDSAVQFKGFWKVLGPLMCPFMKKSANKQLKESFEKLEAICLEDS